MSNSKLTKMKNLDPLTIPLSGRHIIEASAGTGKTYNITKLYIRLLLDNVGNRSQEDTVLSPKNILVMTFTKDATQEIISRVDSGIRESINECDKLINIIDCLDKKNENYTDYLFNDLLDEDKTKYKQLNIQEKLDACNSINDINNIDDCDYISKLKDCFETVLINNKEIKEPFAVLNTKCAKHNKTPIEHKRKLLKKALLEIDEASIFTIHGFCKKVLSQQAFASGMDMDVSMEVNTDDILLETVEDYFRKNINKNDYKFNLLKANNWHTPEKFLDKDKGFKNVIKSEYEIVCDEISINTNEILKEKSTVVNNLKNNPELVELFLNSKTTKEKEGVRVKELPKVLDWLNNDDIFITLDSSVRLFINKTQANKKCYNGIFQPIKELSDLQKEYISIASENFAKESCLKIRDNFQLVKDKKFVLDFDDLIVKLRDSLKISSELVKILQSEYPVALIDEFQDTDSMQYEILDTIYPLDESANDRLLLMIGDPKQAIYGFRGGDIYTYIKAKESAGDNQWSMGTNYRSTDEVVSSYNRLFYQGDFTDSSENNPAENAFSKGINYQVVNSTELSKGNKNKINFNDDKKALTYFLYENDESNINTEEGKTALATWTANEIVNLLNSQKIAEKDIAILVKSFSEANFILKALKKKKLSAVYLSQKDSIFESKEAKEILMVLEGINELENDSLLKQALSTSLLGGTAAKFADYVKDGSTSFDEAKYDAINLRNVWKQDNVMTMLMQMLHQHYVPRNDDKERSLTNILHLAELIKVAENKYKHPHQLIKWFKQQRSENTTGSDENVLRLESDSNLIKIVTIHGSKGLEYPVVFIPFATSVNTKAFNEKIINKYYDKNSNKTVYKIGKGVKEIVNQEMIEESMRLLYVAVTRASQRCYIGVANFKSCKNSSFAQFFKQSKDGFEIEGEKNTLIHNFTENDLENEKSNHLCISQATDKQILEPKKATGISIDNSWRILSYTAITTDNPDYSGSDESKDDTKQNIDHAYLEYRFTAPKGSDVGTFIHKVLEKSDFSVGISEDLLERQMLMFPNVIKDKVNDKKELLNWLNECLDAPIPLIGDSSQNFKLKNLNKHNTLQEAKFHMPLNDDNLWQDKLENILTKYRNNGENAKLPNQVKLYGMLKGEIDLLFEYNGKFYIADYKSNYLGNNLGDYNQKSLCEKNQKSFYDLQYLIYSVALHRYLKINKSDYDFTKDFGGVYYFYLRGMKDGYGVYQATLSHEIIDSLDKLFAGDK